ncbi:MAG TPA: flagellar basal body L-ring protein, partial [Bosea sp. (in: a-proteobacteria)]|nr:flagellar basal body L-ring protein [Bosea sp. (in: a-proteobacteria)]
MTRTNPIAIPAVLGLSLALGACGAADRLANVGQAPALSPIEDPTATKGYKPVQMPMPA